jgi:hypothetical protein
MDERPKFIARLLDGEKLAGLCREFGISRKTGYKVGHYSDTGLEALTDRSRRPYRYADQLPAQIETLVVDLKQDKPAWAAPKIREWLRRFSVFERAFKEFGLPAAIRPTTACPSPAPMPFTDCQSCRCNGCASELPSSASSRGARSKTAAMNAGI